MDINDSAAIPNRGASSAPSFKQNLAGRYNLDRLFAIAAWGATAAAIAVLAWLVFSILVDGLSTFDWQFITSFPSRKPEQAGILPALVGTICVMCVVAAVSFPLGVGAAIYLEEFATDSWFTRLVEINISNLAGVPSIIYGLLGLTVFVRLLSGITKGPTILSGGLTLVLLILPVIIVATREALRAIPDSTRMAGFALGANRWQVVWNHVLPAAMPGILTGMILALSRAIGDTASVIVIGAATFIPFLPTGIHSRFTILPIQIYNWVGRPQAEFHDIAASGIILLMIVLLTMNATAVILRDRFQKRS